MTGENPVRSSTNRVVNICDTVRLEAEEVSFDWGSQELLIIIVSLEVIPVVDDLLLNKGVLGECLNDCTDKV